MINISAGKSEKDQITFYTREFMATAIRNENNEIKTKFFKRDEKTDDAIFQLLAIYSIVKLNIFDGEELRKNHGAEHKVYYAYEKLRRIPSIEEAKRYPRFHRSCGVSIYSAFITAQLIGFVAYAYTAFRIPELILFLIPIFYSNKFPFNLLGIFMQVFTTSKPENENIELAIAALECLEKNS